LWMCGSDGEWGRPFIASGDARRDGEKAREAGHRIRPHRIENDFRARG
jgi:hypothetical protein